MQQIRLLKDRVSSRKDLSVGSNKQRATLVVGDGEHGSIGPVGEPLLEGSWLRPANQSEHWFIRAEECVGKPDEVN